MAGASGKRLDETYKLAWLRGLKTTYYLRTIGATHTEKSTSRAGALNAVAVDGGAGSMASAAGNAVPAAPIASAATASAAYVMPTPGASIEADGPVCTMRPGDAGFEECEACQ